MRLWGGSGVIVPLIMMTMMMIDDGDGDDDDDDCVPALSTWPWMLKPDCVKLMRPLKT